MRTFRILFIDDVVFNKRVTESDVRNAGPSSALSLVKTLISIAEKHIIADSLEVYGSAGMRSVDIPYDQQKRERVESIFSATERKWEPHYFSSLDCLILDLGDVTVPNRFRPSVAEWPGMPDDETLTKVISKYPGICLLVKRRSEIANVGVTYVLTGYDGESMASSPDELLHAYVEQPFCDGIKVKKRGKSNTAFQEIGRELGDRLLAVSKGKIQSSSELHGIEFAAMHDEPLLIVGESGTGKQVIAEEIHRRWMRGKQQMGFAVVENMVTVNCAGFTESLARSELFGIVGGTATDVRSHRMGSVMRAAGIRMDAGSRSNGRPEDEFLQLLLISNRNTFVRSGGDLIYQATEPVGTLFLDEFGDLPLSVQALLLRFLESGEVQPAGYTQGTIRNVKVRIIVATSNSYVAALAGSTAMLRDNGSEPPKIRKDLIFRVKGQVIEAPSVTSSNVGILLDELLSSRSDNAVEWHDSAKQRVRDLIRECENDANLVFGHKRELQRIVSLCDKYASAAVRLGVRNIKGVDACVVDLVWRPSRIPMSEVQTTSNDATPWTFDQFLSDGTVTQETFQGKVLRCLLERVGDPISPNEISEKIEVSCGMKISRNSMTNVVSQLRKKIADNPECGYTLTKGSRADPKVRLQINAVLDS